MRLIKFLFLVGVVLCVSQVSEAQKKMVFEKGIFWKITPKGGGKPSYLYGTMHVSKKLAFRLPDEFYQAIQSSDFVALESNPEKWTEDIEKSMELKELLTLSSMGLKANKSSCFYSYSYGLSPLDNKTLKQQLIYEPQSANELLFRSYGGRMGNFEEDTYLDLYIFKTGRKFGIPIISLEDVAWSLETVMKASFDAADPKKQTNKKSSYQGLSQSDLEDAYRDQNLKKLDSIQRASAPNEDYLNGLLYIRNDTMFHTMETYIQQGKSVFAAVGAAHLGGEKGLLEKFSKAGYTVSAVEYKTNLDPSEQINKLDSIFTPVSFHKQYSKDSTLSFYTPAYTSMSTPSGNVEYLSADMSNGVYYYIGRVNAFTYLSGLTTAQIESKLDSLIFENTQGSILSKNKITYQQYPGFDITSKTKGGKIIRQRILITPLEILFCKVVGKENYFQKYSVDSFFTQLTINYHPLPHTENKLQLVDVSVKMPFSVIENPFEKMAYNGPNFLVQGLNEKGDYFQLLRNYTVRQYEHEEDTFHLNMYVHFIAKDFNFKTIRSTQTTLGKMPAVLVEYMTQDKRPVHAAIVSRSNTIYFLIAATSSKAIAMDFFNSFAVLPDARTKIPIYKDTAEGFMFKTALHPMGGKFSKQLFAQYYSSNASEIAKRKTTFSSVFQENEFGYQFTLDMQEFNPFETYPTVDSFWNSFYDEQYETIKNKFILTKKISHEKDQYKMEVLIRDTNTVNEAKDLYLVSGNKLLQMISFRDTLCANYHLIDTAFASLAFIHSTPPTFLKSKLDTFVTHIYSKDSATKEFLNNNSSFLSILKGDEPRMRALLDTSDVVNKKDDIYSLFIQRLNQDTSRTNLQFLETLYRRNENNAQRQIDILNSLAWMDNEKATMLFRNLLTEAPPLEFEEDDNPLNHYYDTLQLAKKLFPELLQLIDYDEYKLDVVYLLSHLMVDSLIDSSLYEQKVNYFAIKGKEEIKRKTSSKSTLDEQLESDEEEDESGNANYSNLISTINNSNGDEENDYASQMNFSEFYLIKHYENLLTPYKKRPNVMQFFNKMDSTTNKDLRLYKAIDRMEDSLSFDKSIILEYAKLPAYRYKLIHKFHFNKKDHLLPFKITQQEEVAKAKIQNNLGLKEKDTLKLVTKMVAQSNAQKGLVYIYKYKPVKAQEFLYAYLGFFDPSGKQLMLTNTMFKSGIKLEKNTEKELIESIQQQIRVLNRTYITPEQMSNSKGDYNDYLEMFRNMGN